MRVVIASNRLPVTVRADGNGWTLVPSAGGLATALRRVHDNTQGVWIGWSGESSKTTAKFGPGLPEEMARRRLVPVALSQTELSRYYDGFSNGVIWPLFHFLLDKVNLDAEVDWQCYLNVNRKFAEAIAHEHRPGDVVWIHDYQLMMVPGFLRRLVPDARIGFFLHVPFPSADVYRILPWRSEVLESLLGSDLVGFHTASYAHNFELAASQLTNADFAPDGISFNDRLVRVAVYPIGIDVEPFERTAEAPQIEQEILKIRKSHPDKRIVLGVDRLDYTKGLPRRFMSLVRLLERRPALRDKLLFMQIAVPSREKISAYGELRSAVNELVGRINAQYGTLAGGPMQLLYRSISHHPLVALYRSADVMLVTPLRDGMNLVAKEYVASRVDDDGVLVLSEFAGAAAELRESLTVNPYDLGGTASTLASALDMAPDERRIRMQAMRAHVRMYDVHRWAARFVEDLRRQSGSAGEVIVPRPPPLPEAVISGFVAAPERHILLDYDGTLVPFFPLPELAAPDPQLLGILERLTHLPGTTVHIVTGRTRESIEPWLGHLDAPLHAEHGFWSRFPGGEWATNRLGPAAWKDALRPVFKDLVDATPGATLEEKDVSMAFHDRNAEPDEARRRVQWLREELRKRALDELELLEGAKVLEVRLRGVNKGLVANSLVSKLAPTAGILAIGDDRTDEDLFSSLPSSAITVRVGGGASRARYSVPNVAAARDLLARLGG